MWAWTRESVGGGELQGARVPIESLRKKGWAPEWKGRKGGFLMRDEHDTHNILMFATATACIFCRLRASRADPV